MYTELSFDSLELIEQPVRIEGKLYKLREASGAAACKYRDALLSQTELGADGKAGKIKVNTETEPLLVSLCLFDPEGNPVPLATVMGWPSRVIKQLYNRAKEISELDEKEKKAEEGKENPTSGEQGETEDG